MAKQRFRYGAPEAPAAGMPTPVAAPDFSARQTVISAEGDSFKVPSYGWIQVRGANVAHTPSGITKPRVAIEINGVSNVWNMTGRAETYTYVSSSLIPVNPGDLVLLSTGTFADLNAVYYYPAEVYDE